MRFKIRKEKNKLSRQKRKQVLEILFVYRIKSLQIINFAIYLYIDLQFKHLYLYRKEKALF